MAGRSDRVSPHRCCCPLPAGDRRLETAELSSRAIYASFLTNLLGMNWRYGALHFMRHLIDGDCPIDRYQWAMQAGVTHCINKTWTRIYNPQQLAVDRCDPEGSFIRQWVPEVVHLPAEELGLPPKLGNYPKPILDYKNARQRRVRQLDKVRQTFLNQSNVLPHLAPMPESLTPFGADRHSCDVEWAGTTELDLFPPSRLRYVKTATGQVSANLVCSPSRYQASETGISPKVPQSDRQSSRQPCQLGSAEVVLMRDQLETKRFERGQICVPREKTSRTLTGVRLNPFVTSNSESQNKCIAGDVTFE